jgi:hypothetical protein
MIIEKVCVMISHEGNKEKIGKRGNKRLRRQRMIYIFFFDSVI